MFGRHTHCPDTGSQDLKREPSTEQWHAETEKITCYSRQSFPCFHRDKSHVTYVCSWDKSSIRRHTGHIWGRCSWVCSYTDPTHYSWSPKMCECHKCTLRKRINKVTTEIKQTEPLLMYMHCVCLTLAVWIRVEPWATLLTARTSELRPAQTLTDRVTHLRQRAHNTATTIYKQTERGIKLNSNFILKSTWNAFAIHLTYVMWHLSEWKFMFSEIKCRKWLELNWLVHEWAFNTRMEQELSVSLQTTVELLLS